jgi:hypothetical protein
MVVQARPGHAVLDIPSMNGMMMMMMVMAKQVEWIAWMQYSRKIADAGLTFVLMLASLVWCVSHLSMHIYQVITYSSIP